MISPDGATSQIRALERRDHLRHGSATLVELMVVTVIMTIVAVALARAFSSAMTIQQNYRETSAALEQLATEAARIESGLSLARRGTTSNSIFSAVFFMETDGVSFETNRMTGVNRYGVATHTTGDVYELTVASDTRHPGTNEQFRPMLLEACTGAISIVVSVEGTQAVRRLTLTANVPVKLVRPRDINDVRVYFTNESVTLERPIRLWNSF